MQADSVEGTAQAGPEPEEMQQYIYALNTRIVQGLEVADAEIEKALLFQRALNQHKLEKKKGRSKKPAAPAKEIKLEDL